MDENFKELKLEEEGFPKKSSPLSGLTKVGENTYVDGEKFYQEPARVTEAFKMYVQMGKGRTYSKLAETLIRPEYTEWTSNFESVFRMIKDYASKYQWQDRLRGLISKASTEALADAQREALLHTKERIRLAVYVQKEAIKVIEAARLDTLSVEEARKLLKPASELLKLGLSQERAESGDNLAAIKPDKNPREMSDEELEEYAEVLWKNLN